MPTIPTTALDTTPASLAAATTEVVIGCKTATSGLYCDSPSWRDSTSWDGIRKAGPAVFDITAGDKIKFVYSYEHNVWWLPDRAAYDACSFYSGGSELPHWLLRDADGKATGNLIYEAVVTEPGTLYLACELGQHCDDGQKIVINVAAPAETASPPPPLPPPIPPSPPPPSPSPATPPGTPRPSPPPPPCPPDDGACVQEAAEEAARVADDENAASRSARPALAAALVPLLACWLWR